MSTSLNDLPREPRQIPSGSPLPPEKSKEKQQIVQWLKGNKAYVIQFLAPQKEGEDENAYWNRVIDTIQSLDIKELGKKITDYVAGQKKVKKTVSSQVKADTQAIAAFAQGMMRIHTNLTFSPKKPLITPTSESPVSVSHKLVAHFFSGGQVAGASVAGETLEGHPFRDMMRYAKDIFAKVTETKPPISDEQRTEVETAMDQVLEVSQQFETLQASPELDEPNQFATWMVNKIKPLAPGQKFVMPGGWKGNTRGNAGHAMLYEIEKQKDGKYTMRVINSGDGIENHPQALIDGKVKYLPTLDQQDLDESAITNPLVWNLYYCHSPYAGIGFSNNF